MEALCLFLKHFRFIIGVVSFGETYCGGLNNPRPGVYTNVTSHVQWVSDRPPALPTARPPARHPICPPAFPPTCPTTFPPTDPPACPTTFPPTDPPACPPFRLSASPAARPYCHLS